MKVKEIKVKSLSMVDEKIIQNIINIQYDKEDDLYIIFYKEDKSE